MFTIYGTSTCRYCHEAADLLSNSGIPYQYKEIDSEPESLEEFRTKFPTTRTVPQILKDDTYVGGYTELKERLKNEFVTS